jgi:gamma-glutamylaminecyclotransferase
MPLVFLYGTLKRGGANHDVLERLDGRLVGPATTRDRWILVDLGPFPALLPRTPEAETPVHGELWEIDDSALRELDAFEGCPRLYTRERIALLHDTREVEAFVYVYARPRPGAARVVVNGRYDQVGTALPRTSSR